MEFPDISQYKKIGYDTETTGLQYKINKVFGFSVSLPDGRDFYYDIRETPRAVDWANDSFKHYRGTVVCHNASFDYRMSHHTGIYLPIDHLDDTVNRACCIDEHQWIDREGNKPFSLEQLCLKYLGKGKYGNIYEELAEIFGGKPTRSAQILNLQYAPSNIVNPYATTDARRALELYDWQEGEIVRQGIGDIVDFEHSLLPVITRAEMRGIKVDLDYTEQAMRKLDPFIYSAQKTLDSIAGKPINVNSSPQIKAIFEPREIQDGVWVTKDGERVGTTGKGGPSINAEILREMEHPAAKTIIELRSLLKTRDTFLAQHVMAHSIGGYVYPNINQNKGEDGGAGTGRLSYTNPAMQQIPSRNKKVAAVVKPCFLPPDGMVWLDCDMNSFEVRTFADLIKNPKVIAEYKKNPLIDFHQFVGDISGLPRDAEYSGQPNAKQLNLSMIFNSGDGAIAKKMGMSTEPACFLPRGKPDKPENYIHYLKPGPEAARVIQTYHSRLKGVKQLAEREKRNALEKGYVETYFGRRIRFPNPRFAYKASGLRIQATAADLNKENWLEIEKALGNEGHLILNTHDSYSLALPEDWEPHYNKVKKAIESEGRLDIPLILDLSGVGRNWWDALQGKDNAKRSNSSKRAGLKTA